MKALLRSGFLALAIMALAVPAHAGLLEDGLAAWERGEYETALKLLRPLAERGEAEAQYRLGLSYRTEVGVEEWYDAGKKWFQLAATQGHTEAQFSLGRLYDYGHGVNHGKPVDYLEAAKWYRLAAEKGHASAQFYLGVLYDHGDGVPQDYAEAAKWYRLAAQQGHMEAQNNIGSMYNEGQGVPQDHAEAAKWYRLSDGARELLRQYYETVEREQATGGDLEQVRPFASKAPEQAARIAAVLTLWADLHSPA